MSATPDSFEKKSILFENGQPAEILHVRQALDAAEILKALEIPKAQAAIIVSGSTTPFNPQTQKPADRSSGRGVAQAALECEALLLDQGTKEGVSEILGQGVADRGRRTKLVGVLSQGKPARPDEPVTGDEKSLDVNHTHFIVNQQDRPAWQAQMLCGLAEAAAKNKDWIMTVLVGGETEGPLWIWLWRLSAGVGIWW